MKIQSQSRNFLKLCRYIWIYKEKNFIIGSNIDKNGLITKIDKFKYHLKKNRAVRIIVEDRGPHNNSVDDLVEFAKNRIFSYISKDLYFKIEPPQKTFEKNSVSYLIYPKKCVE